MRFLLLLILALGAAGCSRDTTLVVANRLAPGGGGPGAGGSGIYDQPGLDILVRIESDATDFEPEDLLRLFVDGAERTLEVRMGGNYGLLHLFPAPLGSHFVELYRRTGPILDTFTWTAVPYAGPTLTGVSAPSARVGTQVTLTGTGFDAGPLRVFFGGEEGSVVSSTETTLTATIPDTAKPGLLWVLVGAEAADGLVPFQPLDSGDQPIPVPGGPRVHALFPAHGGKETPVRLYGTGFDEDAVPEFPDHDGSRVVEVDTLPFPAIGDLLRTFAVVDPDTRPEVGEFRLRQDGDESNRLPFTVD